MKKILSAFILVSLYFSFTATAQATEVNYKNFEVGVSALAQNSGTSGSGLIRYAPNMMLQEDVRVGLSFDFAPHKFSDETKFNAINVLLNGEYLASSDWAFGASVGSEDWSCSGCGSKTVFAISGRKTIDVTLSTLNIQSAFLQLLTVETDPKTSGLIAGVQIQF